MEKIGLIVGNGKFPLYFIEEAKNSNISVYPIGLFPSVDEEIKRLDNYAEFNIGHIGEIIKYLLLRDVTKIVMLGKVEKRLIFENLILDKYGEKIMEIVPDNKDETLLFAIIGFIRLSGIKVLPQSYLMKKFIFETKCYTEKEPDFDDEKTISIGIEAARLLVYKAAWRESNNLPYSLDAARAKLFAAETAMEVTTKAVQIFGGYGYTREYPVERMMRDAKITEIYEGTSEVQRMVIAANVIK